MHLGAQSGFTQFDQRVTTCAGTTIANNGCVLTPELQNARASANGLQTGAFALYAVGGAAIVTSAILFYVGRPVGYRKTVNVDAATPASPVTVLPIITPTGAGAMATLEF
jgi:hypothetical protein